MRRPLIAILTVLALLLPSFGVRAAAQGAEVQGEAIDRYECTENVSTTSCWDVHGEMHSTATSSRNYSYQINIRSACLTETDNATGEVVDSYCYSNHYRLLIKQNQIHVEREIDFELGSNDYGTYCTYLRFHFANGKLQFRDIVSGSDGEC